MAVGVLRPAKLHPAHRRHAILWWRWCWRADYGAGGHHVRPAEPAHQGLLLAVGHLAAQFFIVWRWKFPWFSNNSSSGVVDRPGRDHLSATPSHRRKSQVRAAFLTSSRPWPRNMVRSPPGGPDGGCGTWTAAQAIGFHDAHQAAGLAVSSFIAVAGALVCLYLLSARWSPKASGIPDLSFKILFMIIIGGVGSIMGSFLGGPSSCCCRSC